MPLLGGYIADFWRPLSRSSLRSMAGTTSSGLGRTRAVTRAASRGLPRRAARVIAEGYRDKYQPFHGYYFEILKGQGIAAPLGKLDFVVQGAMIGGFALVAAPASYEVSGVKTFIVSHADVVYEKDLGPKTLELFSAMDHFRRELESGGSALKG